MWKNQQQKIKISLKQQNHWKLHWQLECWSLTGKDDVEISFLCSTFREERAFLFSLSLWSKRRKWKWITHHQPLQQFNNKHFCSLQHHCHLLLSSLFCPQSFNVFSQSANFPHGVFAHLIWFSICYGLPWIMAHDFNCFLMFYCKIFAWKSHIFVSFVRSFTMCHAKSDVEGNPLWKFSFITVSVSRRQILLFYQIFEDKLLI